MRSDPRAEQFLRYFAQSHRRIYGYIRAQVRSAADADDVLQETSTVLWEKFEEFDPTRDFVRWACGIAHRKVLEHYRKSRRSLPLLNAELAEQYSEQLRDLLEQEDRRTTALSECLERLNERQQSLLNKRYQQEQEIRTIAAALNRSESAIYKSLTKIHDLLFDCIEEKLRTA